MGLSSTILPRMIRVQAQLLEELWLVDIHRIAFTATIPPQVRSSANKLRSDAMAVRGMANTNEITASTNCLLLGRRPTVGWLRGASCAGAGSGGVLGCSGWDQSCSLVGSRCMADMRHTLVRAVTRLGPGIQPEIAGRGLA